MGWAQSNIFQNIIVIGPGGGEFIYNATGTQLLSANAGAITADPILRKTVQQGFSTFNGHGAVVNLLSTSNAAFFQYQDLGTSTQGPLILVVASASGTDPITSVAYQAGMTGVDPAFGDSITTVGANIGLNQVAYTRNAMMAAATGGGASQPKLQLDAPEQTQASHLQMWMTGESPDTSKPAQLILAAVSGAGTLTPQTAALLEIQGNIAASLVKAIVSGALETWHTVGAASQPAFAAGFAAGSPAPRFQLEPINGGRVRLAGQVSLTANQAANTAMFNLPAGYIPSIDQFFVVPNTLSGAVLGGSVVKVVGGSGGVNIVPAGSNGNNVRLDGICFPLD